MYMEFKINMESKTIKLAIADFYKRANLNKLTIQNVADDDIYSNLVFFSNKTAKNRIPYLKRGFFPIQFPHDGGFLETHRASRLVQGFIKILQEIYSVRIFKKNFDNNLFKSQMDPLDIEECDDEDFADAFDIIQTNDCKESKKYDLNIFIEPKLIKSTYK